MDLNVLIIISVIVLVIIFLIILLSYKSKFLVLDIKITEAKKELDALYEIKRELLYSICKKVDEIVGKDLFPDIEEINEESLNSFALSGILNDTENKLINEMNMRKAFIPDEDVATLFSSLENVSIDCSSVEDYYNDNADIFNRLLRKFPSSIVGKMKDYKSIDKYIHEEEEMFEILKD